MCQGLSVMVSSCISFATSYSVMAIAKSILLAKKSTGTSLIFIANYFKQFKFTLMIQKQIQLAFCHLNSQLVSRVYHENNCLVHQLW